MFHLTSWVLQRKAATILITLLLIGWGLYAVIQLKSELLPNINAPYLTVTTVYPGASSDDVNNQVSIPIESAVSQLPGLKSVRSTSQESFSLVLAAFDFGADTKSLQQSLSEKLRTVTLPTGLNGASLQPNVTTLNFSSQPVVNVTLEGRQGQSADELSKWAREVAKPALAKLPDVSNVEVVGDATPLVTINFRPQDLAAKNLSLSEVSQVLQSANVSFPAGTTNLSGQSVPVRTAFSFKSVQELEDLIISGGSGAGASGANTAPNGGNFPPGGANPPAGVMPGGNPAGQIPSDGSPKPSTQAIVRLKDVAEVKQLTVQSSGISRTNGKPGILLQIYKSQTGNTVTVSDGTLAKIGELNHQYGAYKLEAVYDQADQVRRSIAGLVREGLLGAFFAIIIIFVFLRSVRSTLVTAISIPTSVIAAFILLWWQGITLNTLTLGGLAIAVGRVVDDAIVVLENIFRHVQQGEPVGLAVKNGTKEVTGAITSSTLTTAAVFLPLGFVGGVVGQLFLPFALTVVFALLASLLVALTIIPVFASLFITPKMVKPEKHDTWVQRIYTPVLKWSLGHRGLTLLAAFLLLITSIASLGIFKVPVAFLPESGDKLLAVNLNLPAGSDQPRIISATDEIEKVIDSYQKRGVVTLYQTTIAGDSAFTRSQQALGGGSINTRMVVRLDNSANLNEVAKQLRNDLKPLTPEGGSIAIAPYGGFTSNTFSLIVQGPDTAAIRTATDQLIAALQPVKNLANVKSDLTNLTPQIVVTPDPTRSRAGNATLIGSQLRSLLQGQSAGTIRLNGQAATPVLLVLPPPGGTNIDEYIANLKQLSLNGGLKVGDVATVERLDVSNQTTRINQTLAATISADITSEDTGAVSQEANQKVQALSLPAGVTLSQSGTGQQQGEAFSSLGLAMLAAIALVYIVMVIAFGSLLEPFAILFSLPLALIGTIGALVITQRALGLPALIGVLMLIGIVVTNAIVLVDLVNQLRRQGYDRHAALLQAGRTRVRPILMTAFATMLALMPLALGFGEGGSIIAADLGTVVIGGLFTSTFLTLVVVPVVYSLLEEVKERWSERGHSKAPSDNQSQDTLPADILQLAEEPARATTK